MSSEQLQEQCEQGQRELMATNYLEAERLLAEAEGVAWAQRDFDTLARLYMPLQEARRQRRQRCGEGEVCLDLWAEGPLDRVDGRHVVENYPFGQLLVAGWGSIEPAQQVRQLQGQYNLYVETFLGAVYPTPAGPAIVVVPMENSPLPEPIERSTEQLAAALPPHALIFRPEELPRGPRKGTFETYSHVMSLWERLHAPFLAEADAMADPLQRIEAYRRAIAVDYACELAHQKLAALASELVRRGMR